MDIAIVLEKYMKERYYPEEYGTFIKNNRLSLIFGRNTATSKYIDDRLANKVLYVTNKRKNATAIQIIKNIDCVLNSNGISTMHFKGVMLGKQLYDDFDLRMFGDLDFIVKADHFERALELLQLDGFECVSVYDNHHIVLTKDDIDIELHSTLFHPKNNILFAIEDDDLKRINLDDQSVLTMKETTLLLYLLYHHYVHCINDTIFSDYHYFHHYYKRIDVMSIYRYYDIALLIDRFGNLIDWNHCLKILQKAELQIEFKMFLQEFNYIFNGILPKEFLEAMYVKKYKNTECYYVFNYIYKQVERGVIQKYDDIMTEIVNQDIFDRREITCKQHETNQLRFLVTQDKSKPNSSYLQRRIASKNIVDFSFCFDLWIQNDSLIIRLEVYNNALVFIPSRSLKDNPMNVVRCDSVVINIVPAKERYQYHEFIILLEQETQGDFVLRAYDDLLNELRIPRINSCITKTGYQFELEIPLSYLGILNINNNVFYLDLSVSNCDPISRERNTTLALSAPEEYCGDPRRFAKIRINMD